MCERCAACAMMAYCWDGLLGWLLLDPLSVVLLHAWRVAMGSWSDGRLSIDGVAWLVRHTLQALGTSSTAVRAVAQFQHVHRTYCYGLPSNCSHD